MPVFLGLLIIALVALKYQACPNGIDVCATIIISAPLGTCAAPNIKISISPVSICMTDKNKMKCRKRSRPKSGMWRQSSWLVVRNMPVASRRRLSMARRNKRHNRYNVPKLNFCVRASLQFAARNRISPPPDSSHVSAYRPSINNNRHQIKLATLLSSVAQK